MENKEFIPSNNLVNKPYWLYQYKGGEKKFYKPRPNVPSNIQESLDSGGGNTQYVWDDNTHSTYTAYNRNPQYRPIVNKIDTPITGIEVARAAIPNIDIELPPPMDNFIFMYNIDGLGKSGNPRIAEFNSAENLWRISNPFTEEKENIKTKQQFFERVWELNNRHPIVYYESGLLGSGNTFPSRIFVRHD